MLTRNPGLLYSGRFKNSKPVYSFSNSCGDVNEHRHRKTPVKDYLRIVFILLIIIGISSPDLNGQISGAETSNIGDPLNISCEVISHGLDGEPTGIATVNVQGGTPFASFSQKGENINGESSFDFSGESVAVSADGNTLAVGSPWSDNNGENSGQVRVFDWTGSEWLQRGESVNGEYPGDLSGSYVAISQDGNIIAVGAPLNSESPESLGHVRVFQWNGNAWVQAGDDIDGGSSDDGFAIVDLSSSGCRMVIGADVYETLTGRVRVYDYNGSSWVQLGEEIVGDNTYDLFGGAVSISGDGNRIAIGASESFGFAGPGYARIYDWQDGSWVQAGQTLVGESLQFGRSVSLSTDGLRLAVGAPLSGGGATVIYEWNGTIWEQMGNSLLGEAGFERFGRSVSLSAQGDVVAVGAPFEQGDYNGPGKVRLYYWNGEEWQKIAQDLDGMADFDDFGYSVSLSANGRVVGIGAPRNDESEIQAGQAQVYFVDLFYSYLWSNGATAETISGLSAGEYDVMVMDANGSTEECSVTIGTNCDLNNAPHSLDIVEIGFGSSSPKVNGTWVNPDGTSVCEVRGGRISDVSAGTDNPQFANMANTVTSMETNGSTLLFNIPLYNNPEIYFVPNKTYGFEVRCLCEDGTDYTNWSGLEPNSTFVVPNPVLINQVLADPESSDSNLSMIENNELNVFPNPNNGEWISLEIDQEAWSEQVTIRISDMSGRLIEESRITTSQIFRLEFDRTLPQAAYVLSIQDEEKRSYQYFIVE